MKKDEYTAIGLMSGTSLDGLDVALCHFNYEEGKWRFKITDARTFPYQSELKEKLGSAHKLSAFELSALDVEFGHFSAVMVRKFLEGREITIDFLASHGHTVFHQPQRGITWQIGSGAVISADCDHFMYFRFPFERCGTWRAGSATGAGWR